ncbi:MAG: hypothetical protein C0478_05495 [Planctomyces sp.]|nr:hypothetical protein [Planctomyces sp.]
MRVYVSWCRGAALLTVLMLGVMGCGGAAGPPLGQVTGKVTFKNQPVEGALVQFLPADGRPSFGTTESDGTYRMEYTEGHPGAVVGKHTVRISKEPASGEVPADVKAKKTIDPLPMKYNAKSILEADVRSGNNVFDFALEP